MAHNQYQLPEKKQPLGSFDKNNELKPLLPTSNVLSFNKYNDRNIIHHDNNGNSSNRSEAVGLGLMSLNALSLAILNLLIKLIGSRIPSFEISLISSLIETILCLTACFSVGIKNPLGPRRIRGWLTARGLSGALALGTIFYSMTHLPLGDATGLLFLILFYSLLFHERGCQ